MENEAMNIVGEVLSTKYPEFNARFKDLIKKILDKVLSVIFSIEGALRRI